MGAQPRRPRRPGESRRDRRPDTGHEKALARIGARATFGGVNLEGLKHLAVVVALASAAPAERHIVAVGGPRAREIDPRVRVLPAASGSEMQMIILILLPVTVGMAIAARNAAAKDVGAV